jgi:hypothetical protein
VDEWTQDQLAAAVDAYRLMQLRSANGLSVNKAQIYRELSEAYGRTPKAWEYRMQNISHVLFRLNQEWIKGLKPAKNVGAEVTAALVRLLDISPPTAVSSATLTLLERQRQLVNESGYFLPETVEDHRDRVIRSVVQRRGQQEFRIALLDAYGSKCAMTGCGVVDVLEAAHIHPYMGRKTDLVSNGLLLRADLHTLFDLKLIGVDTSSMRICVSPSLATSVYDTLSGRPLAAPTANEYEADKNQLERHRSLCKW